MIIAIIIIVVVLLVLFGFSVRIVRQSTSVIVERLGKYHKTLDTGVHFILPIFDRTLPAISLKERVADFPPQPIITKDNVTMSIDTVVYFQITDPKLYSYGVEKPISAIENLTATTLRNIVGELELDETLTSRDTVNSKMRAILDDATDALISLGVNKLDAYRWTKSVATPESTVEEIIAKVLKGMGR